MRYLMVLLLCFTLVGCANLGLQPLETEPSVCEKPEAAVSWICKVTAEMNTTPEEINGILLDANAIGLITEAYKKEQALKVIDVLEVSLGSTQSYTNLINLVIKETDKAKLIASIVSRRLGSFQSPLIISNFDKELLRYHLEQQRLLLE